MLCFVQSCKCMLKWESKLQFKVKQYLMYAFAFSFHYGKIFLSHVCMKQFLTSWGAVSGTPPARQKTSLSACPSDRCYFSECQPGGHLSSGTWRSAAQRDMIGYHCGTSRQELKVLPYQSWCTACERFPAAAVLTCTHKVTVPKHSNGVKQQQSSPNFLM